MIGLGTGVWLNTGAGAPPPAAPAAPSGLTVSIAETSLAVGDTATASVSVSGTPAPTLAYQWAIDGVDISGATGATYATAAAGALRVRVTATNSEGVVGPVTSAPVTVTVTAQAPGAFSAGMWSLADSPSAGGDTLALTIASLPGDGGSTITTLEYRVDSGSGYGTATALAGTGTGARNITVLASTTASVQIRAVNSVGDGAWSDVKTATPTGLLASEPLAATQGTWVEFDLFDIAPAKGVVDYTLTSGALPGGTGLTFFSVVGQIHGAPTAADVAASPIALTFQRTVDGGAATDIPVSITVTAASVLPYANSNGATVYSNAAAGASNSTTGDTSGNTTDLSVFIDAEFPATLAADMCFFQVAARHFFRVLANGNVQINLDDTASTLIVNLTAAVDVRGGRHRIGITANAGDGVSVFPSATITVDGVVAASTTSATLGVGAFHMSRKPYTVLGETVAGNFGKIVPADVDIYQVAVWNGTIGAGTSAQNAAHDWNALDETDLDVSAIATPMLYLGDDFTTTTLEAGYAGALGFALYDDGVAAAAGSGTALTVTQSASATPLAKKGAVGFGKFATGGRGKTIYRVTSNSTNPATSGSFPWAMTQASSGGGYILIESERTIELPSLTLYSLTDVTIDGRRAPGFGFTLMGAALVLDDSNNCIVRGVNCLPGSNFVGQPFSARDAFEIRRTAVGTSENFYIDEIGVGASTDEGLGCFARGVGRLVQNVTFDRVIMAEACHAGMHYDSPGTLTYDLHSKGMLFSAQNSGTEGSSTRITLHRCALISSHERNPRASAQLEMINCVVANIRNAVGVQAFSGAEWSLINNAWLAGPSGPTTATRQNTGSLIWESGSYYGPFGGRTFPSAWSTPGDVTAGLRDAADVSQQNWDGLVAGADVVSNLETWFEGVKHPFFRRVIGYMTEDTPFSTGWNGAAYEGNYVPDEARAIGAVVTTPSAGALRVALPVATTALPLPSGSSWASCSISIMRAYNAGVTTGLTTLVSPVAGLVDGATWVGDAGRPLVTEAGDLAGGNVDFTGLTAGWYAIRADYTTASGRGAVFYTGRPVQVT